MTDPSLPSTPPATPAAASRAQAEAVLAAQPFNRLVGARLTAFADGEAVLELDVRDDLLQQDGVLHGGAIAYAADNCLTFAGASALGPSVLTGGFAIEYLRPVRGRLLRAHARVVSAGRRRAAVRCDLHSVDDDGSATLCAVAQGTIAAVPPVAGSRA